jgi:hypothetical protein
MEVIKDVPQVWWEIICTYDGEPGSWAMSVGDSAEEAQLNFFSSLADPEKAVITSITPIGNCTAFEALTGAGNEDC